MTKQILLTGAHGYIGSFLYRKLSKKFAITKIDKEFNFNDEKDFNKLMNKNYYSIIFAHGYNSTPLINSKKKELINEIEISKYLEINFYLNLKIIKKYIQTNTSGRVINFSSIYGVKSPKHFLYKNFNKEIGYSVSKAATNMMMKYFGTKLGKKFLFNSIILGGVKGQKLNKFFIKNYKKNTPLGRMINLEEILPVVEFLLDIKNTQTNAQEIVVDGGWLSW